MLKITSFLEYFPIFCPAFFLTSAPCSFFSKLKGFTFGLLGSSCALSGESSFSNSNWLLKAVDLVGFLWKHLILNSFDLTVIAYLLLKRYFLIYIVLCLKSQDIHIFPSLLILVAKSRWFRNSIGMLAQFGLGFV